MVILLSFPPSAVLIVAYSDYTGNDVAIVMLHRFHVAFPSGDTLSKILSALLYWTALSLHFPSCRF